MSVDGGFGVVAYVRDRLVNDVLAAVHYRYADSFRATVAKTINLDGEAISVSGEFFVEAPTVSLRREDGRARVSLTGWARVELTQDGGGHIDESALIRLDAEVLAPLVLEAEKVSFRDLVYLDLSAFDLTSARLSLVWLSPIPGLKAPALALSEEFRSLLVEAIRPMAKKYLKVNVPVDKLDQMRLNLAVKMAFTPRIWPIAIRVLDGAFAVGFDVRDGDQFTTRGDAQLLELPWQRWSDSLNAHRNAANMGGGVRESDGSVLVVMTAPLVLQYGGWNIDLQLKLHSTPNRRFGDTTLALAPGEIVLNTKVTQAQDWPLADAHAQVEVRLRPYRDYIEVLGVTTKYVPLGLAAVFDAFGGEVTRYVKNLVVNRVGGEIRDIDWLLAGANYSGPLPGLAGSPGYPIVNVGHIGTAIEMDVVMCNIGVGVSAAVAGRPYGEPYYLAQVSDDPRLPTLKLTQGICTLTNVQYGTARGFAVKMIDRRTVRDPLMRTVRYEVDDHPTFRRDPSWRTRWIVAVEDRQILVQDEWSSKPGARSLVIDRWSDDLYAAPKVNVGCCHYRPPDDPQWPLAFTVGSMSVDDRWQRDQKYVRWHRRISWQESDGNGPKVDKDGYPVFTGKLRQSAIHKTDVWERCKFSDRGSNRPCGEDGIIYMDELPAPARDGFRNELCPYCFT